MLEQSASDLLEAKVKDWGNFMEGIGGLGYATMKAGQSVKKLYKKFKGEKEKPDEEPDEEAEEPTETAPEEAEEPTETAPEEADIGDVVEAPDVAGDVGEFGEVAGDFADTTGLPAEVEMTDLAPATTEEVAGEFADVSELPAEVEMGSMVEGGVGATEGGTATLGTGGLGATATQTQIMDADPEDLTGDLGEGEATDLLSGGTDAVADGTALIGTSTATAGEVAGTVAGEVGGEVSGMLLGDAIVSAIPVVGEIALIGTAIAGFFMELFGHKHHSTPPPTEVVAGVGADASSLVSRTPMSVV